MLQSPDLDSYMSEFVTLHNRKEKNARKINREFLIP